MSHTLSRKATQWHSVSLNSFVLQLVRKSSSDKVLVIGGGVTLHEALAAAELLSADGVNIRVMDIFSIKPIDKQGILENAAQCGNKVIVVEDHYEEGTYF